MNGFEITTKHLKEAGFQDITDELWSMKNFTFEFGTLGNVLHNLRTNNKYICNTHKDLLKLIDK